MEFIHEVKLFADGACPNNPGPGAVGVLVHDAENDELDRDARLIGDTTNNRAEYHAVIRGLDVCSRHTRGRVEVFSDNKIVVRQCGGSNRFGSDHLRRLFFKVMQRKGLFEEVVFTWVPRDNPFIKEADRLANEALKGRAA